MAVWWPLRTAAAQRRGATFTIDSALSLAWWQVNPHLLHLWATTCPEDPAWLPGVARKVGSRWTFDGSNVKLPNQFTTDDTIHIPLFPRHEIWTACKPAVRGELVAPDTVTWMGAHGKVTVDAAALYSGEQDRDAYARNVLLEVHRYPHIVMIIDSVVDVAHGGRDTVKAVAVGKLQLHGVETPLSVAVSAWPDTGGLRVRGRWHIPVTELWNTYGIGSKWAIGLIGLGRWKDLWLGADLVMRPESAAAP